MRMTRAILTLVFGVTLRAALLGAVLIVGPDNEERLYRKIERYR